MGNEADLLTHLPTAQAGGKYASQVFIDIAAKQVKERIEEEGEMPAWLEPPSYLTVKQAKLWRDAVLTRGVAWFKPSDCMVLEQYAICAADLTAFRERARKADWDLKAEMPYRRALREYRYFADMLGLSIAFRIGLSIKGRIAHPEGSATKKAMNRAVQNAADDLLHGNHIPAAEDVNYLEEELLPGPG